MGGTGDRAEVNLSGVLANTARRIYAGRIVRGSNLSFITIEISVQEWGEDGAVGGLGAIERDEPEVRGGSRGNWGAQNRVTTRNSAGGGSSMSL